MAKKLNNDCQSAVSSISRAVVQIDFQTFIVDVSLFYRVIWLPISKKQLEGMMNLFLTGNASRAAFIGMSVLLLASPAHAAGGALPTLVEDIGVSLLVAGVLAVVFARLKIPSIAAFILAGIIVGPQVLHQVTDPANIEAIAQIGFILLLFVIGLEINIRKLVMGSKSILLAGLIQYPATLLFGFFIAKGLILIGIGGMFEGLPLAPFYIGVAIAGSSSLLVVKLSTAE